KENAAANAPTIAVKTEIQDAISSGFEERSPSWGFLSSSLEERLASAGRSEERPSPAFSPLDSWLMLSEERSSLQRWQRRCQRKLLRLRLRLQPKPCGRKAS